MSTLATPKPSSESATEAFICPNCGSTDVHTAPTRQEFAYGTGADGVTLAATVPVRECHTCGMSYLDGEAEDIRHEAVCRHLGVMTPAEIIAFRQKHGLSASEFAKLTLVDERTLGRWESGAATPPRSLDRFLRLLDARPENFEFLDGLARSGNGTMAVASQRV